MTASGFYEACIIVMLFLAQLYQGMESMGSNFLQYQQEYWCKPENGSTYDIETKYTSDAPIQDCQHGYEFDSSIYDVSVISEFLLIGDSAWIIEILTPLYMAGFAVGALLTGVLSDRMGRKWTFMLMSLIHICGDIITAFSLNEWMYAVGRFFTGAGCKGAYYAALTLMLELVSPNNRALAGMVFQMGFCIGTMIVTGLAYYVRHFRVQQLVLAVGLLTRIAYFWLIPESPRWLIATGRQEEALTQITWLARWCKSPIPEKILDEYSKQKLKSPTSNAISDKPSPVKSAKDTKKGDAGYKYKDLVGHPTMRQYCATICITIASIMLTHNGIGLSMGALAGNIYVNLIFAAILDFPVYGVNIYVVKKFGCVKTTNAFLTFTLVAMAGTVPMLLFEETAYYSSYLSLLGRAVIGSAGSVVWLYLNELYPTALRQRAVGTASSIGCTLSIAAPVIGGTLAHVWQPLPILIFGSLSLVSLLLFLRMPETKGRPMANTIEDSINLKHMRPVDGDTELKFGGYTNKAYALDDTRSSPIVTVGYRQFDALPFTF